MKMRRFALVLLLTAGSIGAEDPTVMGSGEELPDAGFLGIEAGLGYNAYPTSEYFKAPLFFTGASSYREISTRLVILSDMIHASEYFAGSNSVVKNKGLYLYNFGLLDIDYLSWHGKIWSAGFGGGLAHQGFLIPGAQKTAHAIVGRLRGQAFFFWYDFFATQFVVTLPVAFYQSATDSFRMVQGELNLLFDFNGRVRNPEPQSFLFSVSLLYEFIRLGHEIRSYSQHEFMPMLKATVVY